MSIVAKTPRLGGLTLGRSDPLPPFGHPRLVHTYSGRTAIRLAVDMLGLTEGTRVLLPRYHCGSELDALLEAGLDIAFYPVGEYLEADLDAIEAGLRSGARAIYAIHYFGYPQPLEELRRLANVHEAALIEDVALGLYSTAADGSVLGTVGDAGIFSYVKTLPVPDGGGLLMPDGATLPRLRSPALRPTLAATRALLKRRTGGVRDGFDALTEDEKNSWDIRAGLSAHLPLKRASLATRTILARIDHSARVAHHRWAYDRLRMGFSAIAGAQPLMPKRPDGACPAYFPVLVTNPDLFCRNLASAGVEAVRFWRRPHGAVPLDRFPEIGQLRTHVIRLPIHPGVDEDAIARILAAAGGG